MKCSMKSLDLEVGKLQQTTDAVDGVALKKLTLYQLIFIIFFQVSGGPYDTEAAVEAQGALYSILGFVSFPFLWSIPEALITCELSLAYPGNGGYVEWADQAFGKFVGSLMGWWKFIIGVINISAFPEIWEHYIPVQKGWLRGGLTILSTLIFSFLNYLGLEIVGYTVIIMGVLSLSPFVVEHKRKQI